MILIRYVYFRSAVHFSFSCCDHPASPSFFAIPTSYYYSALPHTNIIMLFTKLIFGIIALGTSACEARDILLAVRENPRQPPLAQYSPIYREAQSLPHASSTPNAAPKIAEPSHAELLQGQTCWKHAWINVITTKIFVSIHAKGLVAGWVNALETFDGPMWNISRADVTGIGTTLYWNSM